MPDRLPLAAALSVSVSVSCGLNSKSMTLTPAKGVSVAMSETGWLAAVPTINGMTLLFAVAMIDVVESVVDVPWFVTSLMVMPVVTVLPYAT